VRQENQGDILEGGLGCPHCERTYPIREGIAFLAPATGHGGEAGAKYETAAALSSYLWGHYADLLADPEASTAYRDWAALMNSADGVALDIGAAVGRFSFEMSRKWDFVVGIDASVTFIRTARALLNRRSLRITLPLEGRLAREVDLRLPNAWSYDNLEFVVADALALPFCSHSFSGLASLNLIDKVPQPLRHLRETNRVARRTQAQLLISDPYSWSEQVAAPRDWLGGQPDGPFAGHGADNIANMLQNGSKPRPAWHIERQGHVWWKLRTHANHFELIRSRFIKARR
jgi:SAM-dependent methyltransferase